MHVRNHTDILKDYNHPDDDQGDFTLVSAYGSLQSANAAAKAHWDAEKTEDCPDGDVDAVNEWMKDDGCYAGCAVVETSKRHRFIVTVSKVELKDGQVAAANDHASKETLNKKGAAKKRKAKSESVTVRFHAPDSFQFQGHSISCVGQGL